MNTPLHSNNFDDLVFEHRHKDYGAYALRKSYQDTMTRALIITCSSFCLLAFIGAWWANRKVEIPETPPVFIAESQFKTVEVNLPHVEKPKAPETPKVPEKTRSESGYMTANDHADKTPSRTNAEMNLQNNSNPNGKLDSTSTKEPELPKKDPPADPPKLVKIPDVMPSYEGYQRVIKDNLHYPQVAVENGTSGTVYLSFVVEVDGSISEIEVLKKLGDGCDQEAIRVLKLLKQWKPGFKDGKPVRVPCTLPIKFNLK